MSSTKEGEEELVDVKEASIKSEDEASPTAATDATQKNAAKRRTKTGCLSEYPLLETATEVQHH